MPTTSAASKAWRQNIKARTRNSAVKNSIKKMTVQFRKALTAKNMDSTKKLAAQLTKAYDKAAQKKIVTRNTAGRRKSRVQLALSKVTK